MCEYESFFKMVKDWTVSDYWTQSVRSEIIIDMLISDFVGEMLTSVLSPKPEKVQLLAKEFPIKKPGEQKKKKDGEEVLSNDKVDYLVAADETLYLVELKTTAKSYSQEQFDRMIAIRDKGNEELWKYFFAIMASKCQKKWETDSKKYLNSLYHIEKAAGIPLDESIKSFKAFSDSINKDILDRDQKFLLDKYEGLEIAYIGPEKLKKYLQEGISLVNLNEFIKQEGMAWEQLQGLLSEERKKTWTLVLNILSECIVRDEPA